MRRMNTLMERDEGAVLFARITAPPMNLLGPELVRDLVNLIQRAESDKVVQVIVFSSGDPDCFISHVDVTRVVSTAQRPRGSPGTVDRILVPIPEREPPGLHRPD